MAPRARSALLCVALFAGGCSTSDNATGGDASPDLSGLGLDVAPDASPDASPDVTPDASLDAAPDASPDAAPDVAPDAAPDATPDAAPDATPDVAPDAEPDAAPDVASDVAPVDLGPTCSPGQTLCSGACVELQRDPLHCGACGAACASGEVCDAGRCALRCPTGQAVCAGVCRDTAVDRAHCGACGTACAEGEVCDRGACRLSCGAGLAACGGACRNLQSDPAHCGACSLACAAGQSCVAGACVSPCGAGLSLCAGACVDRNTSVAHCGACNNACATGRSCVAGVCAVVCPTGQTACGDACFNLQTSGANCGTCGRACTTGQACNAGTCAAVMVTPFPTSIHDHQIALDGTTVAIGVSGANLLLRCARADGSLIRPDQTVVTTSFFDTSGSATQVHIGARSNTVLVTWMALPSASGHAMRQYYARVFDASCEPVTGAFAWPSPASGEYVPDVAMAADGRFVVLWKDMDLVAAFYTARGELQGRLTFPTRSICSGGGYGSHVALNPVTGDGVMTCQQHMSNPIYYQRFSAARALLDAAPVRIEQTTAGRASWYESHIVGMNANGEFVVEWQDGTSRTYEANFYDAAGRLVRTVSLGPIGSSQYWDGFRHTHQAVELLGTDFVLRAGPQTTPAWVWRYGPDGVRRGCATLPTSMGTIHSLRANTAATLSTTVGSAVRLNPISLADTAACAPMPTAPVP